MEAKFDVRFIKPRADRATVLVSLDGVDVAVGCVTYGDLGQHDVQVRVLRGHMLRGVSELQGLRAVLNEALTGLVPTKRADYVTDVVQHAVSRAA